MGTFRSALVAFGLLVATFACSYVIASHRITDAMAQGASAARDTVDAGVLDAAPVLTADTIPDATAEPGEALTTVRQFWSYGVWQGIVAILLIMAAAVVRRMEPKDIDGDGKPDPVGWRGWTWTIAGGLLMVGVPLLSIGIGVAGATWNAVGIGLVGALALAINNRNPVRGEKHPEYSPFAKVTGTP